tara:strand:- start:262 stop:669 length:408 start_codon:yes stop_codon:yes gene_type:complete
VLQTENKRELITSILQGGNSLLQKLNPAHLEKVLHYVTTMNDHRLPFVIVTTNIDITHELSKMYEDKIFINQYLVPLLQEYNRIKMLEVNDEIGTFMIIRKSMDLLIELKVHKFLVAANKTKDADGNPNVVEVEF